MLNMVQHLGFLDPFGEIPPVSSTGQAPQVRDDESIFQRHISDKGVFAFLTTILVNLILLTKQFRSADQELVRK